MGCVVVLAPNRHPGSVCCEARHRAALTKAGISGAPLVSCVKPLRGARYTTFPDIRSRSPEVSMRHDIEFPSEGGTCRGWLYRPDASRAGVAAPAIVMAHGFSAVKEMFRLSSYAERFQEAGFVTLVFDFRFLGASDGEPRGRIVSFDQQADYRNAITWLTLQPDVNPERIGAWGTSYSGGHVLHLAAFDRREE